MQRSDKFAEWEGTSEEGRWQPPDDAGGIGTQTSSVKTLPKLTNPDITAEAMEEQKKEEAFSDAFDFAPFWYLNPAECYIAHEADINGI